MNIQSLFLRLNSNDVVKGLIVAVMVAVLGAIQQALSTHNLDVGSYDWSSIFHVAVTAGMGYLGKNFFTTTDGKFLGKV